MGAGPLAAAGLGNLDAARVLECGHLFGQVGVVKDEMVLEESKGGAGMDDRVKVCDHASRPLT